ncbi:MAG TPA: hypothetical protein PLB26_06915 [Rubrivivax sp.]|nr:hypothetical protein [Rubrivivax sp.]
MAGKSTPAAAQPPALGTLQVQTSTAGLAIPIGWGRFRVGGNLLWYGDFKATAYTEPGQGGGKGGGGGSPGTTKYLYDAAVILALCGTQVSGIVSAWKGKQRYSGSTVPGKISVQRYRVTVPAGGVVTVPDAAKFKAAIAVIDPAYIDTGYQGMGG